MIPTYDQHDADYFNSHCASCGKKDRRIRFIYCGECGHPYIIPKLGLIWHDWWSQIKFSLQVDAELWNIGMRDKRWLERGRVLLRHLKPRRFKNIHVCPCCAHDL